MTHHETHDQEGHATTHAAQQIVTNTHSLSIRRLTLPHNLRSLAVVATPTCPGSTSAAAPARCACSWL